MDGLCLDREAEALEDLDRTDRHVDRVEPELRPRLLDRRGEGDFALRRRPLLRKRPCFRPPTPPAGSGCRSSDRSFHRLDHRPEHADHPVRPPEHHDDEDERHHHLPVEERIAKARREEADRDRAEDRTRKARPATDRGPDHELRRQQEPHRLGGDDALMRRVQGAGEARHAGAHREREGLETARPEAEELEPLLVLGDRGQQLSERRPQEISDYHRGEGEGREDREVEVLEGVESGRGRDPGHSVETARHLDQRVRELKAEHREGEGDEGEVGPGADLPMEHERADDPREQGRNQAGAKEDGNEQPRLAPEALEPRAGEIRPDAEEEGLAKGEEAGATPAKGDPLADHSVEEVEPELVGREARPDERHEGEAEEDGPDRGPGHGGADDNAGGRFGGRASGDVTGASRAHGVSARGKRWRSRAR